MITKQINCSSIVPRKFSFFQSIFSGFLLTLQFFLWSSQKISLSSYYPLMFYPSSSPSVRYVYRHWTYLTLCFLYSVLTNIKIWSLFFFNMCFLSWLGIVIDQGQSYVRIWFLIWISILFRFPQCELKFVDCFIYIFFSWHI